MAQPYINTAAGYAAQGAAPVANVGANDINQYMSPYQNAVINSTMANINETNQQQYQGIRGNAASVGALGGSREAVAEAETARQQALASNQTLAGLQNQNYAQALGEANSQQANQQQNAQRAAQGAFTFANLGTTAQNSALQGASAQLQAGGLEQQTNQAGLTAQYQQYLQQLAFPYQQTQFLAGVGLPAAGAMGGTTTTTPPQPNPFSQYAGLGLLGAGLFLKRGGRTPQHMADGGVPNFMDTPSYIPSVRIQVPQAPRPGTTGATTQAPPVSLSQGITGLYNRLGRGTDSPMSNVGSLDQGTLGGTGLEGFGGLYSHGGLVEAVHAIRRGLKRPQHFDDGGSVAFDPNAPGVGNGGTWLPNFGLYAPPSDTSSAPASPLAAPDFDAAFKTASPTPPGTSGPPLVDLARQYDGSFGDTPAASTAPLANNAGPAPLDIKPPRGIRNNNPLNIEAGDYTSGQPGYIGSDGRFAQFQTPEQGINAASNLIDTYNRKYGLNTVSGIVGRWAPTPENNVPAYAGAVAKTMGVDPNQPLDLSDPAVKTSLISAMGQFENGRPIGDVANSPTGSPLALGYAPTGGDTSGNPLAAGPPNGMGNAGQNAGPLNAPPPGSTAQNVDTTRNLFGRPLSDDRLALIAAGLGIMGGTSPHGLTNIGTGGAQGLAALQAQRQAAQQDIRIQDEGKKLAMSAEQFAKSFGLQQQEFGLKQQQAQLSALQPIKIGSRLNFMGQEVPIMAVRDPKNPTQLRLIDPSTGKIGDPIDAQSNPTASSSAVTPNGAPPQTNTPIKRVTSLDDINWDLKGDDFLNQLPPQLKQPVKDYVAGLTMPTGNPRNGDPAIIKKLASTYAASMGMAADDTTFAARRTMRNQLSSSAPSSLGGQINIGNTAMGHLAAMSDAALALGNFDTGIAPLSSLINSARGLTDAQSAKLDALKTEAQHYGQEITKFYAGSPGGEAERNRFIESVNGAKSGPRLAAVIAAEADLMHDRFGNINSQIQGVLGEDGVKQYPVIRPQSLTAFDRIKSNIAKLNGTNPSPNTSSTVPDRVRQNGHTYERQSNGDMKAID